MLESYHSLHTLSCDKLMALVYGSSFRATPEFNLLLFLSSDKICLYLRERHITRHISPIRFSPPTVCFIHRLLIRNYRVIGKASVQSAGPVLYLQHLTACLYQDLYIGRRSRVERKWPPQEGDMSRSLTERLMIGWL